MLSVTRMTHGLARVIGIDANAATLSFAAD
jgi:hypothetical protein